MYRVYVARSTYIAKVIRLKKPRRLIVWNKVVLLIRYILFLGKSMHDKFVRVQ